MAQHFGQQDKDLFRYDIFMINSIYIYMGCNLHESRYIEEGKHFELQPSVASIALQVPSISESSRPSSHALAKYTRAASKTLPLRPGENTVIQITPSKPALKQSCISIFRVTKLQTNGMRSKSIFIIFSACNMGNRSLQRIP